MKYEKKNPRLSVKYVDADTEDVLLEINDRTWMNVGEVLTDYYVTELINSELKDDAPDNLLVLVVGEYKKK